MVQSSGEATSQNITRLRIATVTCGYTDVNEEIVDQVASSCNSNELRIKFFRVGDGLNSRLQQLAVTYEAVEIQSHEMGTAISSVNKTQYQQLPKKMEPKLAVIRARRLLAHHAQPGERYAQSVKRKSIFLRNVDPSSET